MDCYLGIRILVQTARATEACKILLSTQACTHSSTIEYPANECVLYVKLLLLLLLLYC
jgi:hypothetical protein